MSNEKQITYWNEVAGPKWVKIGDAMDARFTEITQLLLSNAAAAPGEAVLDIGCGTGTTALLLADAATPAGRVTGIDISAPMLDVASARSAALPNISYLQADAQTHDFGDQKFNLLTSRFGVMFFSDPFAAFTNLHNAMAPDGRLCFVCWAPLKDNPHWQIPFDLAVEWLGPPAPRHPHAPGPMAFSDAVYVEDILAKSGFSNIRITPSPISIIGESLAEEARIACTLGPSGALLDEKNADDQTRAAIQNAIEDALKTFENNRWVRSPATVYLVNAIKDPNGGKIC
jgi:SAM-dependent methyltransferase